METLGQLASSQLVTISPETAVRGAIRLMVERGISCLVVVMQATPVGILSERDVVSALNQILGFPDLTVNEIMTGPVPTVSAETPVNRAIRLFRRQGTRHLVLTDENLELCGLVTLSDLVHKPPAAVFDQVPNLAALMTADVRTVSPDTSLRTAMTEMSRHRISCLVAAEAGRAAGIFTERDALRVLADGSNLENCRLREVMTSPVGSVPSTMKPSQAVACMKQLHVRRLVAADADGRIAGLITQADLAWLAEWIPDEMERVTPPAA